MIADLTPDEVDMARATLLHVPAAEREPYVVGRLIAMVKRLADGRTDERSQTLARRAYAMALVLAEIQRDEMHHAGGAA